jgi:hypothetical protein
MSLLKKYWGWGFALLIAIFAINTHLQNDKKRGVERKIEESTKIEFENKIFSIVKEAGANYKWIKNFDKKDLFAGLHTIDLQNEWIKNGPIFFVGTIEDLSEKNPKEYLIKVKYSGFELFLIESVLHLHLSCEKNIVDEVIKSNKNVIQRLGTDSIILIASITNIESSKITVESSSEKSGFEIKDLKLGIGHCIRIEPTNEMFPTFKFTQN